MCGTVHVHVQVCSDISTAHNKTRQHAQINPNNNEGQA